MFHTLNGHFKTVEQTQKPLGPQVPTSRTSRFTGSRARSISGCLSCRRRKKKCDEAHPVCSRCKARSEVCVWPGKNRSPEVPAIDIQPHQPHQPQPECVIDDEKIFFDLDAVVHDLNEFKDDLASFQTELEDHRLAKPTRHTQVPDLPLPRPAVDFSMVDFSMADFSMGDFAHAPKLSAQGVAYLNYYQKEYCAFVSIGLPSSNYFASTFLRFAKTNESIAYALAAWGGFYLELRKDKSDFSGPWRYMQDAARCMCQRLGDNLQPTSREEILHLFAFYLIFIGIEVCTGDVRNWRSFMYQCARLIHSSGGLSAVSDMFSRSNDIQWMISDFQFHDIVSSNSLASGPMFPVADYDAALDLGLSYGLDPLQGIVGPLYKLMCRIGSTKAELTSDWQRIDGLIRAGSMQANSMRAAHFEKVQARVDEFAGQIDACQPQSHHMTLLDSVPADKPFHLHLFDLYRHVCKIQLATAIERLPPKTVKIQLSLMKSLDLLDILQNTRFKVSLSLSLMVCGMACSTSYDKTRMISRFRSHRKQYELGNLQRIEETLMEVWELNPDGDTCIDWADYVAGKGWHLYVG